MKQFLMLFAVAGLLGVTRAAFAEETEEPVRSIMIRFCGTGDVQGKVQYVYVDGVPHAPQTWTDYDSKGNPYTTKGLLIDDTCFPTQHCVRIVGDDVHVQRWHTSVTAVGSNHQPPMLNAEDYRLPGDYWMVTAADSGTVVTQSVYMTTNDYYVDPVKGVDGADRDGSQSQPFRTPLYAAERAPNTGGVGSLSVIYCAAGDYREGGYYVNGMTNRVHDFGKFIRFVGAGVGKSILHGKLDLESPTHLANGRGPAAMRAASFSAYDTTSYIQGFTVTEGRNASVVDGNLSTDQGGAGYRVNFADCLITNCAAPRGQTIYVGTLTRCRIIGCGVPDGSISGRVIEGGSAIARSCVFGPQNPGVNNPYNDTFTCYHCTAGYYPVDANNTKRVYGSGAGAYNCVSIPSDTPSDSWNFKMVGCVTKWLNPPPSAKLAAQDVLDADPGFVNVEANDYRLFALSPAIGYGQMPANYFLWYSADVDGKPVVFKDGRPTSGAVQQLVRGVCVSAASNYGNPTKHGVYEVAPGETFTVSIVNATRPPMGFVVDGAFVPGRTYEFVAPTEGEVPSVLVSDMIFGTNWYVNAVSGIDANDGFTPETAKRTLAASMTCNFLAGDVVHAAEGDYAEGYMLRDASDVTKNRVVVKSGVTLQADGARAKTRILGADAPSTPYASYPGCGTGATRCACVSAKGVLRGFTLTGGRTEGDVSGSSGKADCYGGGVLGYTGGVIEDCFITNCVGRSGCGGCGGRYNGCRFIGLISDPVTSWSSYGGDGVYSCYFDWFTGNVSYTRIVNCLIGDKNHTGGTRPYAIYANPDVSHGIRNTICLAGIYNTGAASDAWECTNTVYTGVGGNSSVIKSAGFGGRWTRAQVVAGLTTDADGYWTLPGKESVFVDKDAQVSARGFLGEKDIDGIQRVYNIAADIGPWEYDWRKDFTAAIGYYGAEVTQASPDVTTNRLGKVRLTDETTMTVSVPNPNARRIAFSVQVGTLLAQGGLAEESFTADGAYNFRGPADLFFSFVGTDGWADFGSIYNVPVAVIIVR